jgi:hypothetical protein
VIRQARFHRRRLVLPAAAPLLVPAAAPGLTGAALEAAVDRILTDLTASNLDCALAEKRRQLQGF